MASKSRSAAQAGTVPNIAAQSNIPAAALKRLALFPDTIRIIDNALTVDGLTLTSLAQEYGTPLYIYDRATMDTSLEAYRRALQAYYPGEAQITYAGKAFFCKAIADKLGVARVVIPVGAHFAATPEGVVGKARSGAANRAR